MDDLISRKWLVGCVEEGWIKFDTEKMANASIAISDEYYPNLEEG